MSRLVDNDIALKLAQYDLLDQSIEVIAGDYRSVEILDSLQYRFRLSDDNASLARCGDPETRDRLRTLCQKSSRLPPADNGVVAALSLIPGIDIGEAQIFAVAFQRREDFVYTGDKQSLRALVGSAAGNAVRAALCGRVYCLEQIIAQVIHRFGFDAVATKIARRPHTDASLRAIFGAGSTEFGVFEGLKSYYKALRGETEGLLAPFPDRPC
jgi:hypothetical protein